MKTFSKALLFILTGITALSCSKINGQKVKKIPNREKPVIFYNVQPADLKTGEVDMEVMNWNDKTFFLGTDSLGGGLVQGKMITDYLEKSKPEIIDRNGDGTIGYVLCIGDSGHKDSRGRTEGIRKALGTWDGSVDPQKNKEGSALVGGKPLKVKELDAKIMVGPDGTMWNATAATEAMGNWLTKLDEEIDMVVSNNDQMAMACLQVSSYPEGLPIFGYDAAADALEAVNRGKLSGTISQNADGQMAALMLILRNLADGISGEELFINGFTKEDKYGNKLEIPIEYNPREKSIYLKTIAITKENVKEFLNPQRLEIKEAEYEPLRVFYSTYNETDLFMTTLIRPAAKYYAPLFGIKLSMFGGDGQNESSLLDKFANLRKYDAYVLGIIKQNSGMDYIDKLRY